jgi:DNA-binding response OmpR family regulator
MATSPEETVLIADGDPAVRGMIAAALQHAGFAVRVVEDAIPLLRESSYMVIVHDLDLAPPRREHSLRQLAAIPAALLLRTVVTTTAPAAAAKAIGGKKVFAVISKPFDLQELVATVTQCARRSREEDGGGKRRPRSSRTPKAADPDADPIARLASLEHFISTVPSLQRMLSRPVTSRREAALRSEMRRSVGTLSAVLGEAAREETSHTLAAVFRAASDVAAQLAAQSMHAAHDARASRHDH